MDILTRVKPPLMKGVNMDDKLRQSLQRIIDVHWHIEKDHWEELSNPDDHIFIAFNDVRNYLQKYRRR